MADNNPPVAAAGEIVRVVVYRGPLDPDYPGGDYPTSVRGGLITDPAEIDAIRRRVQAGVRQDRRRAAWRRVLRRISGKGRRRADTQAGR